MVEEGTTTPKRRPQLTSNNCVKQFSARHLKGEQRGIHGKGKASTDKTLQNKVTPKIPNKASARPGCFIAHLGLDGVKICAINQGVCRGETAGLSGPGLTGCVTRCTSQQASAERRVGSVNGLRCWCRQRVRCVQLCVCVCVCVCVCGVYNSVLMNRPMPAPRSLRPLHVPAVSVHSRCYT